MKYPKVSRSYEVISDLPAALQPLHELAYNFRWTWHHPTRDLFRAIDKELWDQLEHNPVLLLNSLTSEKLSRLAEDAAFVSRLEACAKDLATYLSRRTWFEETFPEEVGKTQIAYFCAEFGVSEALPVYSGGLGILAGDHLKAASDLGIPLVGVGLLYARGYFRQRLAPDGWQQEVYPTYDFFQHPLSLLRGEDEQPLRIEVEFPDRTVTCQIWKAMVGRIPLYLLDSNVLENAPTDQGITDTLYGGDEEMRIRQEMILGIGGMKALKVVGVEPTVCHMNEGHAAFLSLERIRQFMVANKVDFRTARQVVVPGNVFTTHTPVPAGFDLFTPNLLERYLSKTLADMDLGFNNFLRLGRIDRDNPGEAFNMAVLAMENSDYVNGVAKLHAKVTRHMFGARWPDFPEAEVPVRAITNGIHTGTWTSKEMVELFDEHLGLDWKNNVSDKEMWKKIQEIPDEDIWEVRENLRGDLVRFARKHLQQRDEQFRQPKPDFGGASGILDPRFFTIGFARRFATYKRATLMLTDKDRLLALLNNTDRPVQIIIAGKSHPRDDAGKGLIRELVQLMQGSARGKMVFLEDYDMKVARAMVQGVDLWLNNPRRPMEASGTSGMKVLANGGLNCSILDGWWDEGYNPQVGFAIGDREERSDVMHQDWLDSRSLYSLLEQEILPKFYHRGESGIPREWVAMIKQSMMQLVPEFSTARMLQDYTSHFYVPSSKGYQYMQNVDNARATLEWRERIQAAWPNVKVNRLEDNVHSRTEMGSNVTVKATVELGALDPKDVQVQLVTGKVGPNRDLVDTTSFNMGVSGGKSGSFDFVAEIPNLIRGHRGYTIRVVPFHPNIEVVAELGICTWAS